MEYIGQVMDLEDALVFIDHLPPAARDQLATGVSQLLLLGDTTPGVLQGEKTRIAAAVASMISGAPARVTIRDGRPTVMLYQEQ